MQRSKKWILSKMPVMRFCPDIDDLYLCAGLIWKTQTSMMTTVRRWDLSTVQMLYVLCFLTFWVVVNSLLHMHYACYIQVLMFELLYLIVFTCLYVMLRMDSNFVEIFGIIIAQLCIIHLVCCSRMQDKSYMCVWKA